MQQAQFGPQAAGSERRPEAGSAQEQEGEELHSGFGLSRNSAARDRPNFFAFVLREFKFGELFCGRFSGLIN